MMLLVLLVCLVSLSFAQGACPTGTINYSDSCYKFVKTPATWFHAEFDCSRNGGHLTSVKNALNNQWLINQSAIHFQSPGSFWIGGSSIPYSYNSTYNNTGYGNWSWSDGNSLSYKNWDTARGYPKNILTYNSIEVHIPSGKWYDTPYTGNLSYVCEIPMNSGSPCKPNWVYFAMTDSCYLVINKNDTWANQLNNCNGFGADLASIHSHGENIFVGELALDTINPVNQNSLYYFWFGWNHGLVGKGNTWEWSDGTPYDYGFFPSISGSTGYMYGSTRSKDFQWDTEYDNHDIYPAICKTPSFNF